MGPSRRALAVSYVYPAVSRLSMFADSEMYAVIPRLLLEPDFIMTYTKENINDYSRL